MLTSKYAAQLFVALAGQMLSVHLGMGHNNDQGLLNLTGFAQWLYTTGYRVLTDRGYSHGNAVVHVPEAGTRDAETLAWNRGNRQQKSLKSCEVSSRLCLHS